MRLVNIVEFVDASVELPGERHGGHHENIVPSR